MFVGMFGMYGNLYLFLYDAPMTCIQMFNPPILRNPRFINIRHYTVRVGFKLITPTFDNFFPLFYVFYTVTRDSPRLCTDALLILKCIMHVQYYTYNIHINLPLESLYLFKKNASKSVGWF
jgi:hypothetical protein